MSIELHILDWLQGLHTPVGDVLMVFFSRLADSGFIWIILALALIVFPKQRKTGMIVAVALILDVSLCNGILKHAFARVRPYDVNQSVQLLVERLSDYSFPSGHTAASFAATAALFMTKQKKFWIPALILSVIITFSRMYLYVHYPTDILGGALVGVICGVLGYLICTKLLPEKWWQLIRAK